MNFDVIAKNLITQNRPTKTGQVKDLVQSLEHAGFSRDDILTELRNLYDSTEEDVIKKQVLEMVSKMHGMLNPDEVKRETPIINITVQGDNTRVGLMICPPIASGEATT